MGAKKWFISGLAGFVLATPVANTIEKFTSHYDSGKQTQADVSSDYKTGALESIADLLSPYNAYAGDVPSPFPNDPAFRYFDGGVYGETGYYPQEKWDKLNRGMNDKDGDIGFVFNKQLELYQILGKHIENIYKKSTHFNIVFSPKSNEIAVDFRIDGKLYTGFKKLEPGMMDALIKYDIK